MKLRIRTRGSTYVRKLKIALDTLDCNNAAVDIVMKKTPSKPKVFRSPFEVAIFFLIYLDGSFEARAL